jgi:hypothetical protein
VRTLALLGAFACALLARSSALADDPQLVSATLEDAEQVTVGDQIGYRAEIAHDLGTSLVFPAGAQLGDADIIGGGQTVTTPSGDGLVTTVTYRLAAFSTGPLLVGPLPVTALDATGTPVGQFEVAPLELNVLSSLGAEGAVELRDIRGQYTPPPAPSNSLRPAAYAVAGVALAITAIAAFFLLSRRRRRHQDEGGPVLAPEERAAQDLSALAGRGLLAGDPRENYATLSRAVRTYLAASYKFPALASSTAEIEREMLRRGLDRWQARLVSGLLGECDDVIYAGYVPAQARAESDLNLAYQVVEMAERPAHTPVSAPVAGS